MYIYHHHHHVVPLARISLTLSRYFSQSFIVPDRSSGLHPVSLYSCCMYVRAGRPAFARPYVGVHKSTSLMSSSLLLQRCPACLLRLTLNTWMHLHVCMCTRIHTHQKTLKEHLLIYIKNIYIDPRSLRTINSNGIFTYTNPGIKKYHILSKQSLLWKQK